MLFTLSQRISTKTPRQEMVRTVAFKAESRDGLAAHVKNYLAGHEPSNGEWESTEIPDKFFGSRVKGFKVDYLSFVDEQGRDITPSFPYVLWCKEKAEAAHV